MQCPAYIWQFLYTKIVHERNAHPDVRPAACSIVFVIAYFYAPKKTPELLMMLIAYFVVLLLSAASMYIPYYIRDRAATVEDMQSLYTGISILSLLAHLAFAVGLGILLNRYTGAK